ncbi:MAG: PKD-like domain-containing protein [Chryseolinea sp.]
MLRFYKVTWVVLLLVGFLSTAPQWSLAQCTITNLDSDYCVDDAAFALTGGTNYFGPGISGSTFTPATAGAGTHTVYSSTGIASSYYVSTAGTFSPDATISSAVSFPAAPANESSALIPLGFTFNFFGIDYTGLWINANGYVSFTLNNSSTSQVLPTAGAPNNLIAGAWDNLNITTGGAVTTAVSGVAPLRRFLINFVNVRHSGGPQTVSFQIQLHESTNIVEIHSPSIQDDGGAGITQGIENFDGSLGYATTGRNKTNWTATNDYVAYIPMCVDIRTVDVTPLPTNSLSVTAGATAVCPSTGASVTVGSSEAGVLYQLQRVSDNAVLSAFAAGTGGNLTIVSDPLVASTQIKVYAKNFTTACDAYLSNTVTVTPSLTAPVIVTHPPNRVVCQGTNTTFSINAGATSSPAYSWQISTDGGGTYSNLADGGVYSGVLTSTLTLTNVPTTYDGYLYRVQVSGACSPPIVSNAGLLTVNQTSLITAQPLAQVVCEDGVAQFTTAVSGTALTYQWREGGNPLTNAGIYSGVNTSTLTLTGVTSALNGRMYDVVVTGSCGNVTSSAVAISVSDKPEIATQPSSSIICQGSNTTFFITAGATTLPVYQWQLSSNGGVSYTNLTNTGIYTGTTSATLSITGAPLSSNGYLFRAEINGSCSPSVFSNSGLLTVNESPAIVTQPTPQTICESTTTAFSVAASGTGLTYQWQEDGTNITDGGVYSGANTATLTLTGIPTAFNGRTYRANVTATCGLLTSSSAILNVNKIPNAMAMDGAICSGGTTSIAITNPNSVTGTSFTWTIQSSTNVTGASSGSGSTIAQTLSSTDGVNPGIVTYLIQPSAAGCNGTPYAVSVSVKPLPDAAASPQSICSGSSTSIAITNPNGVAGTTFTWSASSTNATGASSGSGGTISQVLTNTDGINGGSVTYTITPSANGCPGPTFPVTVTIEPVPVITNSPESLTLTICSEEALNFMPTSTLSGTTYVWTSSITGPVSAASVTASGAGSIIDSPENSGNVTGTVTYRITPSKGGCSGTVVNFVVTVRPHPSASATDVTICSGMTAVVSIMPAPKNIGSTTYAWTVLASANVVGAANGDGSTISQQLSTTNSTAGSAVYTITPMANGCTGPAINVTVTVNPAATVSAGADYSVCEPVSIPLSGTIGGSASSGTWTVVSGAGVLTSSAMSGSTVTATYTVAAADIGTAATFELTTNDPDAAGPCAIVSEQVVITINRQAKVTVPADYTACEPSSINLTGTLSGSATSGLWSIISGNGVLSASSVTGSNVTASYSVDAADLSTTLQFRLSTNDPDGFGPCTVATDDIQVIVNPSATVNAGSDLSVCEDQSVNISAIAGGTTSSVLWSGGSGAAQFAPANNVNTTYTLTPADITAGTITLTITTNDPDAAGPCVPGSDNVIVKVNKRPSVFLGGLESTYAENSSIDNLDGFPLGGVFTGPGIIAGTNSFDPANAGYGGVTIRYTYADPVTSCINFTERTTIVNPLTSIDFFILEDNRPNAIGNPQICANQNELTLIGIPAASTGQVTTKFRGPSAVLGPRIFYDGTEWKLNTNGLPAGTYLIEYIYTNASNATDTLTKDLIVFAAPQAVIDVGNSCIDDVVTFYESSSIPNNNLGGTIMSWNWLFDEGSIGSSGSVSEPQYNYLNAGPKTISLEVITNQGCGNTVLKSIIIGKPPVADFTWTGYCKGDATKFADKSTSQFGSINGYAWDFGDGVTATTMNPAHNYGTFATYNVSLSVSTDAGCSSDTTKQLYIQDLQTLSATSPYEINFENGAETWVSVTNEGDLNNSWLFGLPNGTDINSAASGSNAFWTGANNGSYFNNENSFVIGPCLDMSELKRPMISINYWVDAQGGFDGAVMQYSVNGGASWQTVGDAEGGGINWYNDRNLPGQPGGQTNFAWSDSVPTWTSGRYNLDQIIPALRDTVMFRIAFGSNDDNPSDEMLNGFAFDDIYIGEKTRNVLVEHFANVNSTASNQATAYLAQIYEDQVDEKDSSDFISIEYHIPNPQFDQLHTDNPQDPIARALLYNVSQPPTTVMDGIQNSYFNGFTANINAEELDRRALEDPTFAIDIDTIQAGAGTSTEMKLAIKYTYIDAARPLTTRVTMQAALIERGIGNNGPVVRKLLLNSEGKTVDRTWVAGDSELSNIEYAVDVPIGNPDSLFIVAFVQDNIVGGTSSKRILQSKVVKSRRKVGVNITGIEDNPVTGELKELSIYPNPASKELKLTVPTILLRRYTWKMIDQRGIMVLGGDMKQDFSEGPQEIDISGLANGMYFMSIQTGEHSVVYRKVVVMNKN